MFVHLIEGFRGRPVAWMTNRLTLTAASACKRRREHMYYNINVHHTELNLMAYKNFNCVHKKPLLP